MSHDSSNLNAPRERAEAQGGEASTGPRAISEGEERSGDALKNTAPSTTCSVQITNGESQFCSVEEEMKLLLAGEDSMDIGYYVDFHERSWAEVKTAMTTEKILARKTEGIRSKYGPYLVLPAGRKGYPWHIQYPGYHVFFQETRTPNSPAPNVLVCVNSEYLWHHSYEELDAELASVIESFDAVILKQKISRVDLAADFLIPSGLKLDDLQRHCVPNDLSNSSHGKGMTLETFYHGAKGSPVMIRIYNKSKEIARTGIKTWFGDLWKGASHENS